MRGVMVVLLALLVFEGVVVPVQPARAATGAVRSVLLHRGDPLMTDPVQVRVDALAADGAGATFTGTVTLKVGPTSSTTTISGDGTDSVEADISTARLPTGPATLTAVIRGTTGAAVRVVRPHFVEIHGPLEVSAFGCTALTRAGGQILFAVTRMAGEPIRTPRSRSVPLLPYIAASGRRSMMIDDNWQPLTTTGQITVMRGSRPVAVLPLPRRVRRLVFGASWHPRVPIGTYTTRLVLTDAVGRTVTATGGLTVAARPGLPCEG